jgi:L-rhamnose isomerase
MKMLRVRFRMRALLLAVLLFSVFFGGLRSRSRYFQSMASEYRTKAKAFRAEKELRRKTSLMNECPSFPWALAWESIAEEYDYAARHPWLPEPK